MRITSEQLTKLLNEDIKDYLNNYGTAFSEIATEKIMTLAKEQMERFYNDYSPKLYRRTDNLKRHSYYPLLNDEMHDGNIYRGGIHIDATHMHEYYSNSHDPVTGSLKLLKGAKESVAYYSWMEGDHGRPIKNPKYDKNDKSSGREYFYEGHKTLPSPYQTIENMFDSIKKDALSKAEQKAQSAKYRLEYRWK